MKNSSTPLYRPGPINNAQDVVNAIRRINGMVRIATDNNIRVALNQYKYKQGAKSAPANGAAGIDNGE